MDYLHAITSRDSTKIFSTGLDGEVFRTRIGGAETDKAVIPKSGFDKLKVVAYHIQGNNTCHINCRIMVELADSAFCLPVQTV